MMFCTGPRPAEDVPEAAEDSARGAYAEHIFTDPLGAGYSQR